MARQGDLDSQGDMKKSLATDCDWVKSNFKSRPSARFPEKKRPACRHFRFHFRRLRALNPAQGRPHPAGFVLHMLKTRAAVGCPLRPLIVRCAFCTC